MSTVLVKTFSAPPLCEREILRYAGSHASDQNVTGLLQQCLDELGDRLSYKVCFLELPVHTDASGCDFGCFSVPSAKLSANLSGCQRCLVFGATIGIEIDRLIARYGRIAPAKALLFQAIGAERIEALCDAFCAEYEREYGVTLRPRFSPGYGDLPLDTQRDLFSVLDCSRKIGLNLTESLLMMPSKSVTAFAGIGNHSTSTNRNKCDFCDNRDCTFRSIV